MNDPLDAVFVTGEEARKLEYGRRLAMLAKYLDNMPIEIKPLFKERLSLISPAELAQLRAQAAMLDDYAETIRRHEITIAEQARQLEEARKLLYECSLGDIGSGPFRNEVSLWLASHADNDEVGWIDNILAANAPAPQPDLVGK